MTAWRRSPALAPFFAAPPSETTPALLELAHAQAARRTPADLARQFARDPFVRPSAFDLRTLHRLDGLALDAAADFEAVQLSPVAPLGTCSAIAPTSQDRVLSTGRGSEVVSDPTNVLALEAARRLAQDAPRATVRLCTTHEVLRAQEVPPLPGYAQHFHMFAMIEAGRALPDEGFEVQAVVRQLTVLDRIFEGATALGARMPDRQAIVFRAARREATAARVEAALRAALPHVAVVREALESTYYDGLRVLFGARSLDGEPLPIADVGVFDWVGRLNNDRRLRMVASGLGIQLIAARFGAR